MSDNTKAPRSVGMVAPVPKMTRTGVVLGALYKELQEEGVPSDLAHEIVRDAARELVARNGIGVKATAFGNDEVAA